ncbi:Zn-ribbon domain-containing OB-fold protein [Zhongshania sp.]|jgi:uncharacterized OB-fold protein|uniref:Zn-ribbon domain-containing OB-fold protein n=1 Tax=Zhongshania sp. TaxID=1971902 RepID=UPI002A7EB4DB|nr:zinc ribbon domain-containing protein [Zhongshania sp.]
MIPTIAKEFREGLSNGKLLIQQCKDCEKFNMYPRYACPHCQSKNLGWHESTGRGKLHSYTVLRLGAPEGFEDELPYALGIIKLNDGVQLLARLLPSAEGNWNHYRCDSDVSFTPASPESVVKRPCAWFSAAD